MARKKTEEEPAVGAPAWMATFGDLMSLLLTFFVLLISFSTIREEDFNNAIGSLQGALGIIEPKLDPLQLVRRERTRPVSYQYRFVKQFDVVGLKPKTYPLPQPENPSENSVTDITEEITNFAREEGLANYLSVDYTERGVKIRLPGHLLFERGSNTIKNSEQTHKILKKIISLVQKLPYGIVIEGHTDNKSINNPNYTSNWELSGARSISVLHYFQTQGIHPQRLEAVACGEYKPFRNNTTLMGRKLNRRVEINIDVSKIYPTKS